MKIWKTGLLGIVLLAVLIWLPARASAGEVRIGIGGSVTISTRYGDFCIGYRHRPQYPGDYWCGTPQVHRRIYEQRYGPYQGPGYPAYRVLSGGLSGSGYPVHSILNGGLSLRTGYGSRAPGYGYSPPPPYYGYPYQQPPVGGQPPVVVIVPEDRRDDSERARRWESEREQDELAVLLSQLKSRDRKECEGAIDALAEISFEKREKRIREALESTLKEDSRVEIRRKVAKVLGEMEDEAALPALESVANKDPDPDVRKEAAKAVERTRFAKPLFQLQSDDKDDRKEAVKKLAKLPYPERVIGILGKVLLSDPEPEVRQEAAEQLGELKNPRALPVLKRAGSDPDEDVRKAVAKAQKKIT